MEKHGTALILLSAYKIVCVNPLNVIAKVDVRLNRTFCFFKKKEYCAFLRYHVKCK